VQPSTAKWTSPAPATVYAARPPAAQLAVTPPPALPVTDPTTAIAEPTLF
jgi:hypothetical protein